MKHKQKKVNKKRVEEKQNFRELEVKRQDKEELGW